MITIAIITGAMFGGIFGLKTGSSAWLIELLVAMGILGVVYLPAVPLVNAIIAAGFAGFLIGNAFGSIVRKIAGDPKGPTQGKPDVPTASNDKEKKS